MAGLINILSLLKAQQVDSAPLFEILPELESLSDDASVDTLDNTIIAEQEEIRGLHINDLPEELMLAIFSCLEKPSDRVKCLLVCHKWNRIADDDALWTSVTFNITKRNLSPFRNARSLERVFRAKELTLTAEPEETRHGGPPVTQSRDQVPAQNFLVFFDMWARSRCDGVRVSLPIRTFKCRLFEPETSDTRPWHELYSNLHVRGERLFVADLDKYDWRRRSLEMPEPLADGLPLFPYLETLDLSGSGQLSLKISKILRTFSFGVTNLILDGCGSVDDSYSKKEAKAFPLPSLSITRLRELSLRRTNWGHKFNIELLELFPNLELLDLSNPEPDLLVWRNYNHRNDRLLAVEWIKLLARNRQKVAKCQLLLDMRGSSKIWYDPKKGEFKGYVYSMASECKNLPKMDAKFF
ncbi:hypothetical protein K402DRAFT_456259 [Aulographum hederae CBS 113979]|uniref:F-box domain-containing protein n=1 Tax=Aulographum hederae CBS 113979 TaxID=1176131 RepID=A0A6G1GSK8_9PEZI|nr:hypothetical protein K402DRAFT_456259 [Aulographum hederae CBS 113979]